MSDAAVEEMRSSRGSAAELKALFVLLRSELPEGNIFVFEGDDDRGIYFSWFRQINAALRYEPFSCGGKGGVIKLWQALRRDVNGLQNNVYYFVDRDFDELRGHLIDESVFMTDKYSVENYLINESVLDNTLKIEFHCHASPLIRAGIIELFNNVYSQFLEVSTDFNRDLHVVRRLPLELKKHLPKTVAKLAFVQLESVSSSGVAVHEVVVSDPQVVAEHRAACAAEFDGFEARDRYRGKFSMAFFKAWLDILAAERKEPGSQYFVGLSPNVKVATDRLNLATLAARSDPPVGLAEFIEKVIA